MKNNYFLCFILIVLIIAGCGEREDFVARIGDDVITVSDFKDRVSKLPSSYQQVIEANKKNFLDEIVVDSLIYKEALGQKVDKSKEIQDVIEEARKKIIIAKFLQDNVENKVTVGDDLVMKYFKENQDEFVTPETYRASLIRVKTEEDAKLVLFELQNGADFRRVAVQRSIDPTAAKGGDMGSFVLGQLDPQFADALARLKEGEISGIITHKAGYYILKLTEHKERAIENFEDVKDRIKHNLIQVKRKLAFSDLVKGLKSKYKVNINESSPLFKDGKDGQKNVKD